MDKENLKGKRKMDEYDETQAAAANNHHYYQQEDAMVTMERDNNNYEYYNNQEVVAGQDQDQDQYVRDYQLPPGFVFAPSDQDLLSIYLKKKIENPTWSSDFPFIPEVKIYEYHPQQLIEGLEEQSAFFFTQRTKRYTNGKRSARTVEGHGYWRMSGTTNTITEGGRNVGEKSCLVFNIGLQSVKPRVATNWLMKEYRIPDKEWALCEIYFKGHSRTK
ncbi:hypothetical protein MKX01_032614 [Papaver californicum]|nr:hypothetical protein MKX01_032614 [Papaver californicum]